jgi:hypothetical protein
VLQPSVSLSPSRRRRPLLLRPSRNRSTSRSPLRLLKLPKRPGASDSLVILSGSRADLPLAEAKAVRGGAKTRSSGSKRLSWSVYGDSQGQTQGDRLALFLETCLSTPGRRLACSRRGLSLDRGRSLVTLFCVRFGSGGGLRLVRRQNPARNHFYSPHPIFGWREARRFGT